MCIYVHTFYVLIYSHLCSYVFMYFMHVLYASPYFYTHHHGVYAALMHLYIIVGVFVPTYSLCHGTYIYPNTTDAPWGHDLEGRRPPPGRVTQRDECGGLPCRIVELHPWHGKDRVHITTRGTWYTRHWLYYRSTEGTYGTSWSLCYRPTELTTIIQIN